MFKNRIDKLLASKIVDSKAITCASARNLSPYRIPHYYILLLLLLLNPKKKLIIIFISKSKSLHQNLHLVALIFMLSLGQYNVNQKLQQRIDSSAGISEPRSQIEDKSDKLGVLAQPSLISQLHERHQRQKSKVRKIGEQKDDERDRQRLLGFKLFAYGIAKDAEPKGGEARRPPRALAPQHQTTVVAHLRLLPVRHTPELTSKIATVRTCLMHLHHRYSRYVFQLEVFFFPPLVNVVERVGSFARLRLHVQTLDRVARVLARLGDQKRVARRHIRQQLAVHFQMGLVYLADEIDGPGAEEHHYGERHPECDYGKVCNEHA
ncbi:hypothetical protein BpHYR1_041306 [Brachionus plicatilis]|uniref:Uncharacterized protein n=1 Tax=Brachionus plicatilis TaxID=10195 RepID=A0A3M7R537_BRAPC|nr:hypothetical protein BpHYR1_041306 [Brachionus plicatilis]